MSLYAGIPSLAGFRSKFHLFFAAPSCGAYLLALIGIVTSVISRWAAGRGCLELVWEALPWCGVVHRTRSLPKKTSQDRWRERIYERASEGVPLGSQKPTQDPCTSPPLSLHEMNLSLVNQSTPQCGRTPSYSARLPKCPLPVIGTTQAGQRRTEQITHITGDREQLGISIR